MILQIRQKKCNVMNFQKFDYNRPIRKLTLTNKIRNSAIKERIE